MSKNRYGRRSGAGDVVAALVAIVLLLTIHVALVFGFGLITLYGVGHTNQSS